MGAWGVKALESDTGLDFLIDVEYYIKDKLNDQHKASITLSEIITLAKKTDWLNQNSDDCNSDDLDYTYDSTAMAIVETYLNYHRKEGLEAYLDEEETIHLWRDCVVEFLADEASLTYLLQHLTAMQQSQTDEREYVELWRESNSWNEWLNHLETLITAIKNELAK